MWSAEPTGTVGAAGCRTACGDAGCECRANTPLLYHDHVALVAIDGTQLSCLCGDFQVLAQALLKPQKCHYKNIPFTASNYFLFIKL